MLLTRRITDLIAESEILAVLGAQQIAMHQQGGFTGTGNDGIVGQQLGADPFGEDRAEQEVAVAALHENPGAAGTAGGEGLLRLQREFAVLVITDPGFIKITEDEECFDAAALICQQFQERGGGFRTRRIQMQIGDEDLTHGASAARIWRMMIGLAGVASQIPERGPTFTLRMPSMISMPSTTRPKTV